MSKGPVRPYYTEKGASTAFYDVVTAADRSLDGDVDLYAGLAPAGGTILELGAGTGRVALGLAERGFTVTGLDIAPAMLALAKEKRAKLPAGVAQRVKFVRADMTTFDLGRTFDIVICTFYALAHVPVGAAWEKVFKATAKHLVPGGVAAFHLPIPAKMGSTPPPPSRQVLLEGAPDGRSVALYVADQTMDSDTGRMDLTLKYAVSGPRGVQETFERLTLYAGDPAPFAATAGLEQVGTPLPMGVDGFVHVFRLP